MTDIISAFAALEIRTTAEFAHLHSRVSLLEDDMILEDDEESLAGSPNAHRTFQPTTGKRPRPTKNTARVKQYARLVRAERELHKTIVDLEETKQALHETRAQLALLGQETMGQYRMIRSLAEAFGAWSGGMVGDTEVRTMCRDGFLSVEANPALSQIADWMVDMMGLDDEM